MRGSGRQPNVLPPPRTNRSTALGPRDVQTQLTQRLLESLQRTYCAIDLNEISLVELVAKIKECSRRLSLQLMHWSQPQNGEPARALLLSDDYVWITVFIWRTGYHEATVEIQKQDGASYAYQLSAKQLLDGVQGELPEIVHKVDDIPRIMRLMQEENALRACFFGMDAAGRTRGVPINSNTDLSMVHCFLVHSGPENPQRRGFEILVDLANPQKGVASSVLFSRVMLIGTTAPGTESMEAREIQTVILDIIQHRQMTVAQSMETWDLPHEYFQEMDSPAFTSSGMHVMVMLALRVLDNCLETCMALEPYEANSTVYMPALLVDNFLLHANNSTSVNLIFTLLTDIEQADKNAHIARVATSCLRRMCMASKAALQETMRLGGKKTVEKAHGIGKSSHAKLEWECEQFLLMVLR